GAWRTTTRACSSCCSPPTPVPDTGRRWHDSNPRPRARSTEVRDEPARAHLHPAARAAHARVHPAARPPSPAPGEVLGAVAVARTRARDPRVVIDAARALLGPRRHQDAGIHVPAHGDHVPA